MPRTMLGQVRQHHRCAGLEQRVVLVVVVIDVVLVVVVVLPLPALAVRRMHDTGATGWLLFVPVYGTLRAAFFAGEPVVNRYGNPPTR